MTSSPLGWGVVLWKAAIQHLKNKTPTIHSWVLQINHRAHVEHRYLEKMLLADLCQGFFR